jgi:hypothetical protein
MPAQTMPISTDNKANDPSQYPRLRLEKDQRARIVCLEDPVYGYTHNLRAPKVVNQGPVYEVSDRDGSQIMKMDFIGRPLCLGDNGILADRGVDPKNCPICRAASESDTVAKPQRRFAMHVISYSILPGKFEVATPFTVQLLAWSFADSVFNKLADFVAEHGPLPQRDLLLGPCTRPAFQTYDIGISGRLAVWAAGGGGLPKEETQARTIATFKGNRCPDLMVFVGRSVPEHYMLEDLDRIAQRWRIVQRHQEAPTADPLGAAAAAQDKDLQTSLDGLLDRDPDKAQAPSGVDALDVQALLDQAAPAPPLAAPAPQVTREDLTNPKPGPEVPDEPAAEAAVEEPKVPDVPIPDAKPAAQDPLDVTQLLAELEEQG